MGNTIGKFTNGGAVQPVSDNLQTKPVILAPKQGANQMGEPLANNANTRRANLNDYGAAMRYKLESKTIIRATANDAPKADNDKHNFQTVGGDWRTRDADQTKLKFYRMGEDTSGTTRFDDEYFKDTNGEFIHLNKNGALIDLPENAGRAKPENVTDFDWDGFERLTPNRVPADYTSTGKTIAFDNPKDAADSVNVMKRYVVDNNLLNGAWDEAKAVDAFKSALADGAKVEIVEIGKRGDGKTEYKVKIDDESLKKLRTRLNEYKAQVRSDFADGRAGQAEETKMALEAPITITNATIKTVNEIKNTTVDVVTLSPPSDFMPDPNKGIKSATNIPEISHPSRMFNRDITGKYNPKGLTMGKAVDTATATIAPFAVGGALRSAESPNTLRTLGAFPDFVVKEGKWNYFFDRGIKYDAHNTPRAASNKIALEKLGIYDDAAGKKKLMDIFEEGLKISLKDKKSRDYGTTITTHVKVSDIGGIDVKYFYPRDVMNAKPQVTSMIPKIYE